MGFVSGMMGPYMQPIPALGSAAMFISLFAAFVFTPYLAISKWLRPSMHYLEAAEKREHKEAEKLEKLFRKLLVPLIESKSKRTLFKLVLWGTFAFTLSFFYFKWVAVKMLPLDNKPEYSVVIDMPEGTALPVTANLAHRMAEKLRATQPEITAIQLYAGTARPFDFNGMVRHYYLRSDPWQGELQIQLLHKKQRKRSSHQMAVEAREVLAKLVAGTGAKIAVVEMPPGPPVLQSVVAEIHGPSPEVRRQFARDMTDVFSKAQSLVDVDNLLRESYDYWRFDVDTEKAVRAGISVDVINRNLAMALGGAPMGDVKEQAGHEPMKIVMQVPLSARSDIERLGDLPVQSAAGMTLPLRELGRFQRVPEEDIIYRKDLRAIEYVTADVGGRLAAPIYGMFQIQDVLDETGYQAPDGVVPQGYWTDAPPSDRVSSWEWTGEWTVTYETFRDMGAAFAVALVLIYILVVWEFGNFRIPLVIMAPIPLTLLGIIPAHFIMFSLNMGGEFTATSMIGWIALAGIIVRNSILLVDFSIHEVQKGVPVAESVIRACKTRTRPILITALALVAGSSVIFTDPIFQGMAISLASGVLVSTVLTLIVIPLGCVAASKDLCEVAAATAAPGVHVPCANGNGNGHGNGAAAAPPASPAKAGGKPGLALRLWMGLVEVVSMAFYLVRGILLLVTDLVKGLFKPKKTYPRVPPASPPPAPPTAPPPPAPTGGGGGESGPSPVSGPDSSPSAPPAPAPAPAGPASSAIPEGEPSLAAASERQEPAGLGMSMEGPGVVHSASAPAGASAPPALAPATRDTPAEETRTEPAIPPVAAPQVAKGDQSPATGGRKKPVMPAAALIQKKAPRRGIRLKTDADDGPGYD